jgi:hypothetical protein
MIRLAFFSIAQSLRGLGFAVFRRGGGKRTADGRAIG